MKRAAALFVIAFVGAFASGQSGGQFQITQAVIAAGGSSDLSGESDGKAIRLQGTAGQSVAGSTSTGAPYSLQSGFWHYFLSPTAAPVSISGRVSNAHGRPISRALVTITAGSGSTRTALTNPVGYFILEGIDAADLQLIMVSHRGYQFAPVLITPTSDIVGIEIIADP